MSFFKKSTKKESDISSLASYEERVSNEINFYKDCENVHDLPDIFHYWSNRYLLPKQTCFGFTSPDNFFEKHCRDFCLSHVEDTTEIRILSVGSGNGELEVGIVKALSDSGISNFSMECMDINQQMLDRAIGLAEEKGVKKYIKVNQSDFNEWKPEHQYHVVLANQSLHHVLHLEHLFDAIHEGLTHDGLFLTSDMIGRNGHMRWPEALEILQRLWDELPPRYKYNQLLKRQEDIFINHDCSTEGFEGIRAQDVLPLLVERFNFELFIPFANLILIFIDRAFGHNFDVNNKFDTDFIDRVHKIDEESILAGIIKPTQMLAVMTKSTVEELKLTHPKLTPEFSIRHYD